MSSRPSAALALRQHSGVIAVSAAVVLGVLMRAAGWTWGFPADLHPDEWVIVRGALDLVHRKSFEPSLYFRPDHLEIQLSYLAYTFYSHVFVHMPVEGAYARHPEHFLFISRAICTMFGIAMIVLAYLIGKRFHRTIGMIAAVLFALCPAFVENSQYATPDVPLTAMLMLVVLACMHYLETPRLQSLLVACAATSAAIAIKYPGALGTLTIASVVVLAAVRDRRWWRIPGHGALAVVAVIGFLFVISPVLFTNSRAVIDSVKAENGDSSSTPGFDWATNVHFYYDSYLLAVGVIVALLTLVGLIVVVLERTSQAVPLLLSPAYWLLLSVVTLHWPRWALPMFVGPLVLAALGAYRGYLWLRERGTLGRWLVPVTALLAALALGNMVVNSAPFAVRMFSQDTRLAMKPKLDELGVTKDNTIYEGYTPLLPGAPKEIFPELRDVDGRLVPVHPGRRFVLLNTCFDGRFMVDPRFATQKRFYEQLDAQAPLVDRITGVQDWGHSSLEVRNLLRAPHTLWGYLTGGHSGCAIELRRLPLT